MEKPTSFPEESTDREQEITQLHNMIPDAPQWDFVTEGPATFDEEKVMHPTEVTNRIAKTAMRDDVMAIAGNYLG